MSAITIIRGGGDLASGVALRLFRAGLKIMIFELPQPLVVRRLVAFADAVYRGQVTIEGVKGAHVKNLAQAFESLHNGEIPVLIDPDAMALQNFRNLLPDYSPIILVDGRMTKHTSEERLKLEDFTIGLGPGFIAGENCDVVVETNRGHTMGRVIWKGSAESNTGVPDIVNDRDIERVLRAPSDGILITCVEIGDHVETGQIVAQIGEQEITVPFSGVIRGLIHTGMHVPKELKIGDVDPRDDPRLCRLVSDKSLAVGGGVLEAILSKPELREFLWK